MKKRIPRVVEVNRSLYDSIESYRRDTIHESRTEPHSGPSRRGTQYIAPTMLPPPPEAVPQEGSIEYLAGEFLATVEGLEEGHPNDDRALTVANAVAALDILRYDEILGAGSFGTAASLSDGRVLKLTTDPTEVQAGAVLVGKTLKQVVRIYGAWFIQGVTASTIVGWDPKGEEEIRKPMRVGVLLEERVLAAKQAVEAGYIEKRELSRITKIVTDEKTRLDVWPHNLIKLSRAKARARPTRGQPVD